MPSRMDVKRKLLSRSQRVKALDMHPDEPWICAALYDGHLLVWDIEVPRLIKTIEVCSLPVRAVKFIARKNWLVTGSDDLQIRVFNYNTFERVQQLEEHSDYIRSIAVHPVQPFILSASDDMTIRLWDWEKGWKCTQVFEGHHHYVMQVVFNPKDNNTFASASFDHTIKVWSIGSPTANFTLEGHSKGVNCVDYHLGSDKPYLASGSDDNTIKIWDYQTKACVQTLEGHAQNVSSVAFHPGMPIILTGSEDGTVRVWHSNTYRLESTFNYGLERVWTMVCRRDKNMVGIGYDEGLVVISIGREEPAMSMDSTGKMVCARHTELLQANLRTLNFGPEGWDSVQDGEVLPVNFKEMSTAELLPHYLAHNSNGRYVVVCGDGEYMIYTAMALRNKAFGQGLEFVWSTSDPNVYAVRESNALVRVFKQFKEVRTFRLDCGIEQIFGGHLLGVRSMLGLTFYDWLTDRLVRRIEVANASAVYWNESGSILAVCATDSVYSLHYKAEQVPLDVEPTPGSVEESEGYESAFEVEPNGQLNVGVTSGCWFGDVFLFTTNTNRLCYVVGGELVTLAHLERSMYLLGYLPKENRVFLGDKELKIVSFHLLLSVLDYQTAVMRQDLTAADAILPSIPLKDNHRTRVAQFLEKQGYKAQALKVTTDLDHKFDLALTLNDLELATSIAKQCDTNIAESKWKQLAEASCRALRFDLAEQCLAQTGDLASRLLLASCAGDSQLIGQIADQAAVNTSSANAAKNPTSNIAFLAYFINGRLDECLDLLVKANRVPEAAFFARSYLPNRVSEIVELWRAWIATGKGAGAAGSNKANAKLSQSLANPDQYPNLFPNYEASLQAQSAWQSALGQRASQPGLASTYSTSVANTDRDLLNEPGPGIINTATHQLPPLSHSPPPPEIDPIPAPVAPPLKDNSLEVLTHHELDSVPTTHHGVISVDDDVEEEEEEESSGEEEEYEEDEETDDEVEEDEESEDDEEQAPAAKPSNIVAAPPQSSNHHQQGPITNQQHLDFSDDWGDDD